MDVVFRRQKKVGDGREVGQNGTWKGLNTYGAAQNDLWDAAWQGLDAYV